MKAVFHILIFTSCLNVLQGAAVKLHSEAPIKVQRIGTDSHLIDFGRVAFGNLSIAHTSNRSEPIIVHFGEDIKNGRVNRKPPGTVRYAKTEVELTESAGYVIEPPANKRNTTHPKAVRTNPNWGVLLPFRWVEIEGYHGDLKASQIQRRAAYLATWDDGAAAFQCSDNWLNRIWELCRHSIKATTFAGVYVDGDRERIPYEADAYLNQLSHYATDSDLQMARDTFDLLMQQPTWPTEWAPHMIFMAKADWLHSGDQKWLAERYESLKTKVLFERRGPDGLITSNAQQMKRDDIVDWPPGERDDFVFTERNSVVNAFHLRALLDLKELAEACGHESDAARFRRDFETSYAHFQSTFFNPSTGLYLDGIGTDHSSMHANLFPMAFGLVPADNRQHVTRWLSAQEMNCSVYAAQYLLEALFENGADEDALRLMTANNDRSWRHMVESGATITWEAWDMKYKPNQDWNHAWGAAPANILSRYVLGVQAKVPGWAVAKVRPHTGGLGYASGKVPTPHGSVEIDWKLAESMQLTLKLPPDMKAILEIPGAENASNILINGKPATAQFKKGYWHFHQLVSGEVYVEIH
jgi:hypothetical protein